MLQKGQHLVPDGRGSCRMCSHRLEESKFVVVMVASVLVFNEDGLIKGFDVIAADEWKDLITNITALIAHTFE